MRDAETVLGIIRRRGRRRLPLGDVYRQLFNPELYRRSYGKLYRNDGAMTKGVTAETVDGMSLGKIDGLSNGFDMNAIDGPLCVGLTSRKRMGKRGRSAYRRGRINSCKMWSAPSWKRTTSRNSPTSLTASGRARCHSALQRIKRVWHGTKWFIEGDIKGCFNNIDHTILLDILRENITDNRFLRLIQGLLQAGYLEEWRYNPSLSGTPQGGTVSPILANIYMDREVDP